jgi:hypothetical protein
MKNLIIIGLSAAIMACTSLKPAKKATTANVQENVSNVVPLPTGKYFIVNAAGLALTPLNPSVAQNVVLQPFNHGGLQQWQIIKQPGSANSYTIKLVGADALAFQSYFVKDHTPMINSGRGTIFKIQAVPGRTDQWYIKNMQYNGDAMHSFIFSPELPVEIRFDPATPEAKFMWHFEKVVD